MSGRPPRDITGAGIMAPGRETLAHAPSAGSPTHRGPVDVELREVRAVALPLLISVPHAGWRVPPEAQPYCVLSEQEIIDDGDGGAGQVYDIEGEVDAFVTSDIARAIVDLNRAPDDIRKDGVVKTHTCWDVPVYDPPLPPTVARRLIDAYHRPYHDRLQDLAATGVLAGVDCHTMAATAPPEAPDPGQPRPEICISDGDGSLPGPWFDALAEALQAAFGTAPRRNDPFQGGYIIRQHSRELPWVQIELNRGPWMSEEEKRLCVIDALGRWIRRLEKLRMGRPRRPRRHARGRPAPAQGRSATGASRRR